MDRFVCIHGHFYQPPRENPWLESVETQDSAAPFHDWNERITSESYAPNGASRVLNEKKKIVGIVNNYARISHNFGPTLLSWLEENAQRVYRGILDADRAGAQRFSGHGPAMAQVYNHIIMPLASHRDKLTQIRWGIADFQHRYDRMPEGMWLAETAVDRATLDLLAQSGIRFVVLAPAQCKHIRAIAGGVDAAWKAVNVSTLDTRVAYRVPLDQGRAIDAFFYDGSISQAVAFEGLLSSGDRFANRLLGGFLPQQPGPQLVHIATDGESYGHHHRHGEMALSYALDLLEADGVKLTVYGEYLDIAPPQHEAEVHDNSAWSCSHGVERWRSDCGCSTPVAGWNQQWRTPLRQALDWLRDQTSSLGEALAARILLPAPTGENPLWDARDQYIDAILDRSAPNVDAFLQKFLRHASDADARTSFLQLMELERHTLLMYTSCGWFFDDISGIETVQILEYAGRVLQLAKVLFPEDGPALEPAFQQLLAHAHSNVAQHGDGAAIYSRRVTRQVVTLEKVCAHYAIRSMFDETNPSHGPVEVFCYQVEREAHELHASGRARLLIGRANVRSMLTRESHDMEYAVLHFGDQNLSASIRPASDPGADASQAFAQFTAAARKAFLLGDLPEVVRQMDRTLGASNYSLQSLFEDEQRRILDLLLSRTLQEVETGLRGIHSQHTSLLHFFEQAGMPQPAALRFVSEFVTTANLYQAMQRDPIQHDEVVALLHTITAEKLTVDKEKLRFMATQRAKHALLQVQNTARLSRAAARARVDSREPVEAASLAIERAVAVIETLRQLPVDLNLWQAQNLRHQIWLEEQLSATPVASSASPRSVDHGRSWGQRLRCLGELLDIAVDELYVESPAPVLN